VKRWAIFSKKSNEVFDLKPKRSASEFRRIPDVANIAELLDGHVTLEVECLERLYLNGYIGALATPGGLVTFMRVQLGKPIPSPVVLGQVSEKFREAVKAHAERQRSGLSVSAQRAERRHCQRTPPSAM
jgi:hypothetical protein